MKEKTRMFEPPSVNKNLVLGDCFGDFPNGFPNY